MKGRVATESEVHKKYSELDEVPDRCCHWQDPETGEIVCRRFGEVLGQRKSARSLGTEVKQSNEAPRNLFGGGLGSNEGDLIYDLRGYQYKKIRREVDEQTNRQGALFQDEITEIESNKNIIDPAGQNYARRSTFLKNKASLEIMKNRIRNAITNMLEREPAYNGHSVQWQQVSEEMFKVCEGLLAENFERYFTAVDPKFGETRYTLLLALAFEQVCGHPPIPILKPQATSGALTHQKETC